jgi:hypothetical protein
VRDILQQSATRIGDVQGEYDGAGHSDNYGHGRIDAAAAVRLARARLGR